MNLQDIQQLRKMIPVGVSEAKSLLEKSLGDFEKARSFFIQNEIDKIHVLKQEDKSLIGQLFFEEDYDINRTLDKLDDVIFERNFKLENYKSRAHDLNMTEAWLLTVQSYGFMNSLQTSNFSSIVLVIKEIGLENFANTLDQGNKLLAQKEVEFKDLEEEALLDAVEGLKKSHEYQFVLEAFKMNVLLNPDFFKIFKRMQKSILG